MERALTSAYVSIFAGAAAEAEVEEGAAAEGAAANEMLEVFTGAVVGAGRTTDAAAAPPSVLSRLFCCLRACLRWRFSCLRETGGSPAAAGALPAAAAAGARVGAVAEAEAEGAVGGAAAEAGAAAEGAEVPAAAAAAFTRSTAAGSCLNLHLSPN